MNDQTYTPKHVDIETQGAEMNSASRADSIPELIRQLADDVSTLMTTEVALAKAEVREAADEAKAGIAGLAGGAAVAFGGLLILLLAAVYALSNAVAPWLAALIVGVIAAGTGYAMIKAGQKKIEPGAFVPERAVDSVRKDKDMAKRAAS